MVVNKFGGLKTGWLHPFILPNLVGLATGILKNPGSLLIPFIMWFNPTPFFFDYPLFAGWSQQDILAVYLKESYLNFFSIIATYIGFILTKIQPIKIKFYPPRQLKPKIIIVFVIALAIGFYLLQLQGGITESISNIGKGRFRALENLRHFTAIIGLTPYVFILWYLFRNKIIAKWYFWVMLLLSCTLQFIIIGSRGGTVFPLVVLTISWILINKKIPIIRIIALGLTILVLIGLLGEIRKSSWSTTDGRADFSALMEFNISESLQTAQEDIQSRPNSTLGIFGYVPNRVNHLWGETYVGVVTFFVPRFIWKDKPRGVGAYAGAMIWGGRDNAKNYTAASIPASAVAEAYWNFSFPGVFIAFFIFGSYLRWLANFFQKYSNYGLVKIFYIITIFSLNGPSSTSIVPYIQQVIFIILLGIILGVLRPFSKQKVSNLNYNSFR
ncbi:O-antigen polymerase [Cyanobacterium aponinum UTEX 3222]|uniref:O-antigen polymerase n=1 Tax=Cyanobacterium aponinum TaxID=379064 RepID=UPI00308F7A48|nr:O-antigen polymerase [Cyanobacterium aponinum UTEX 3222]